MLHFSAGVTKFVEGVRRGGLEAFGECGIGFLAKKKTESPNLKTPDLEGAMVLSYCFGMELLAPSIRYEPFETPDQGFRV